MQLYAYTDRVHPLHGNGLNFKFSNKSKSNRSQNFRNNIIIVL